MLFFANFLKSLYDYLKAKQLIENRTKFTASSISVKVPFKTNLFLFKDLDLKPLHLLRGI